MTQKQLQHLPRYHYVGPSSASTDVVQVSDSYLRTTVPSVEAVEMGSEAYAEQFNAMNSSLMSLGQDLGLDLSDRVRPTNFIHLFSGAEYVNVRKQFGLGLGSVAVHSTSGHVLASEHKTDLGTLANANHELVHTASYKSIRPIQKDGQYMPVRSRDGYAVHGGIRLDGLTEILTEVTNIDLIRNYWPKHPELAHLASDEYENPGYLGGLIFIDGLLQCHFDDPKTALKPMERGLFTGRIGELRQLTETVGMETMRSIAYVDVRDSDAMLRLAHMAGLDEAARKIESGDQTNLLAWL
jgi:hypothetical protein